MTKGTLLVLTKDKCFSKCDLTWKTQQLRETITNLNLLLKIF